jgi:hypothetical protein
MKLLITIGVVIAALVGGCWIWLDRWLGPHTIDVPPAVSGEISGGSSERKPLTDEQLGAISDWLAAHRSGWQAQVETAPGPAAIIELHHAGGTTTALDIYQGLPGLPGWNATIVLRHFADPKHPHGRIQKFPRDDFQALVRLLGR